MHHISNDYSPKPVFILSCERSGSTMLRYIIDTHSEVACPAHLYLGRLCADLNTFFSGTLAQIENLDRRYEQHLHWAVRKTRQTIQEVMDTYIKGKDKKIWCEKTPMNLEFLSHLEGCFPDARYICLYRQCMDVVNSCINRSRYTFLPEHILYVHRNPGNILAAMVENWVEKTDIMQKFELKNSDRCHRVKYESIVSSPEKILPDMFRFIGVNWESDLLERVFSIDHDVGEGDGKAFLSSGIRQNTVGRGVDIPRNGVPGHLLQRVDALLSNLDYPMLDEYYSRVREGDLENESPIEEKIDLVEVIEHQFTKAVKNKKQFPLLSGTWKIFVKDKQNLCWVIDFTAREPIIKRGDFISDSTIRLSSYVLQEIIAGRMDPMLAFSQGEISFEGNQILAEAFGKLILSKSP
ncbi:MAG: sulfotransferase [Burkholderiales bacterium]|nr:sulfotransferase [Burkholderiales bacterium]